MLVIYWGCLIVGGLFVLLAILVSTRGSDANPGVDLSHPDPDISPQLLAAGHVSGPDARIEATPIEANIEVAPPRRSYASRTGISRRSKFWTVGLGCFGLMGVLLSALHLPGPAVFLLALSTGVGIGFGVDLLLRWLAYRRVDLLRTRNLVGQVGVVQRSLKAGRCGRVRFKVKASQVDYVAYTDDLQGFQPGDAVLAVGLKKNRLWVASADPVANQ